MNRNQRNKNRDTAIWLLLKTPPKYVCERCGEKTHTDHYIAVTPPYDFWICPNLYGPDGRRNEPNMNILGSFA